MTPEAMALLHHASFRMPRPWNAVEFRELLASPRVFAFRVGERALLIGQVVADEAELLTLAVDPGFRRQGLGRRLVRQFLVEARGRGATSAFLEVAATNLGAMALYEACGFAETGRRRGYYRGPERAVDAVLMGCGLHI